MTKNVDPGEAPPVLVLPTGLWRQIKSAFDSHAPNEAAAFILLQLGRESRSRRFLAESVLFPSADDYETQSPTAIRLTANCVAQVMKAARRAKAGLMLVHSHPFAESPAPSSVDLDGEVLLLPSIANRLGDAPVGRLIVGPSSAHAAIIAPTDLVGPLRVEVIGESRDLIPESSEACDQRVQASEISRIFDRQMRAFGAVGQERLSDVRVCVVGAGGTGSMVIQQLAHLGISDFVLVDSDVVEVTNLNRLVGATPEDVGRAKVDVAARQIGLVRPGARIAAIRGDIQDSSVAGRALEADFLFCCTDSHGSRAVVNQLAYQFFLPMIDMGVVIDPVDVSATQIVGRSQLVGPGLPCLLCCGVLDSEQVRRDLLTDTERAVDRYIVSGNNPAPSVISINGVVASISVTMFLAFEVGLAFPPRQMMMRLDEGRFRAVLTTAKAGCPVCSSVGALARGMSWPVPGRPVRTER